MNTEKSIREYLVSKGCLVTQTYKYRPMGGNIYINCEFTYKCEYYRLSYNTWYHNWTIHKHDLYPIGMKRYERLLEGEIVYSNIYEDINESLDKFFKEVV